MTAYPITSKYFRHQLFKCEGYIPILKSIPFLKPDAADTAFAPVHCDLDESKLPEKPRLGPDYLEGRKFQTPEEAALFVSDYMASLPNIDDLEYGYELRQSEGQFVLGKSVEGMSIGGLDGYNAVNTDGSIISCSEEDFGDIQSGGHSHPNSKELGRIFSWGDLQSTYLSDPIQIEIDGKEGAYKFGSLYDAHTGQTYAIYLKDGVEPPNILLASGLSKPEDREKFDEWLKKSQENGDLVVKYLGDNKGEVEPPTLSFSSGGNDPKNIEADVT